MYSLGVLLYHLVTNAYPVDGRSRSELEQAQGMLEAHLRSTLDFVYPPSKKDRS